jgi:hypothetical protein
MSRSGRSWIITSHPAAAPRSADTPVTAPPGSSAFNRATAAFTRGAVRPLMVTCAPSAARARAAANPMPAVEPVTRARLPCNPRSILTILLVREDQVVIASGPVGPRGDPAALEPWPLDCFGRKRPRND